MLKQGTDTGSLTWQRCGTAAPPYGLSRQLHHPYYSVNILFSFFKRKEQKRKTEGTSLSQAFSLIVSDILTVYISVTPPLLFFFFSITFIFVPFLPPYHSAFPALCMFFLSSPPLLFCLSFQLFNLSSSLFFSYYTPVFPLFSCLCVLCLFALHPLLLRHKRDQVT